MLALSLFRNAISITCGGLTVKIHNFLREIGVKNPSEEGSKLNINGGLTRRLTLVCP